jgi:hypothetical protein
MVTATDTPEGRMAMGRITVSTLAMGVALVFVSSASAAQETGGAGYPDRGVASNIEGQLTTEVGQGSLPFTGMNLVLIVIGAVLLLVLGTMLLLKSRTRRGELPQG